MKVKVYVEGGGDGNALRTRCRRGFAEFFQRAGLAGRMPAVVACGSRSDAYDSFRTAAAQAGADDFPMLLVDSEAPVNSAPWAHLLSRDGWQKPDGCDDEHAHLMVQCMEAWLLADREQLGRFFGQGFLAKAIPNQTDVEQVPKATVLASLKKATRGCRTKGEYDKSRHSFDVLGRVDPVKVRSASAHADRLIAMLTVKCGP